MATISRISNGQIAAVTPLEQQLRDGKAGATRIVQVPPGLGRLARGDGRDCKLTLALQVGPSGRVIATYL